MKLEPLVDPHKVSMPPLHIQLELMKTFVKNPRFSRISKYLEYSFPKLSCTSSSWNFHWTADMEDPGVPGIPRAFHLQRIDLLRFAWKSQGWQLWRMIKTLVKSYEKNGHWLFLKVHIVGAHLNFKVMWAQWEEQDYCFQHFMLNFEHCYQGQWWKHGRLLLGK